MWAIFMAHSRSLFTRLVVGVLCLSVFGAGCTKGPDAATTAASKKVNLVIWAVVDDEDVYDAMLTDYHKLHPYISTEFRRFRNEEYENELLNALAEDRGPDIFLIHNTWVGKYQSKILPMPQSTKVAIQTVQGTLKKELVYSLQSMPSVSVRQFKDDYPDAVAKDFLRVVNVSPNPDKKDYQTRVLGIPMSVDTMGMYVNKDLLNAAGVTTIPQDWDAFQIAVKKLVKQSPTGDILQSGAAIGTGANIERSPDILSVLMMQNGAHMSADDGTPTFNTLPKELEGQREQPPAFQALGFYTDFANPGKEVYTWNDKQPNSLDAFTAGKTAFFFGYNYHLPIVRARGPRINLGLSKMPQIPGNPIVNIASYWGWTVSKKTKNGDLAWNLLNFMRQPEENVKYLKAAHRPAALKSQLADQLEDEDVGVFASQVLTAQSWYRGTDPRAADDAFVTLIETVLATPELINQAMTVALEKIAQTIPYAP